MWSCARVCVCTAAVRPRLVGDVVVPLSSTHQWRRPAERHLEPTSEQTELHETAESLGVYRRSATGLTAAQQPALAVVRPTMSRECESRLSQVKDVSESVSSLHQYQQTTAL